MMDWKDLGSVCGIIKVLFRHFPEEAEENHENHHSYKSKPLSPHQQVTLSSDTPYITDTTGTISIMYLLLHMPKYM